MDHDKRYIYRKKLEKFCHEYSTIPHTAKKQRAHFQRHFICVFRSGIVGIRDPDMMDIKDKMANARKHRFLFLKSQFINKLIKHLRYHKSDKTHS